MNGGGEQFLDKVTTHLEKELAVTEAKAKRHREGNLTVGLELEIINYNFSNDDVSEAAKLKSKKIDALQEVGLPITYDALREVPLPYSQSVHEQLKAFLYLLHAKIIEGSDDHIGVHLNIGGFKRLDSNFYVLQQMVSAAGLMEEEIDPLDFFHPLYENNEHWAKPLYEWDLKSPRGLPFKVRRNGVIEFRWLGAVYDFQYSAKGYETLVDTCEALAAWQKVQDHDKGLSEKDKQLAKIWDEMKTEALIKFEEYGIPAYTVDHFYTDAEAFARQDSKIRHAVIDGSRMFGARRIRARRKNMYEIFRNGRSKIRQVLKKTESV